MTRLDVLDKVGQLHMPAPIVTGKEDVSTTPEVTRETAQAIPNAAYRLIDPGVHMMILESRSDRSIRLHGKGDRLREMFFSRAVGTLLDKYLATRGYPTSSPFFVTHRKARLPRRADLTADGYARLSCRQADTLWKCYTPDWDLHQLRHTAISLRAAHDYTEVDLKRFSGHSSLRSLERYIADNREVAKRKARVGTPTALPVT